MAEGRTMRKPRDYDSELKTLDDKARLLKQRQVQQLGELVIATGANRSEEHTSELQSLMRISYAVFCLKKTHKALLNLVTDVSSKPHRVIPLFTDQTNNLTST